MVGKSWQQFSDSDGMYHISQVDPGMYTFMFYGAGYQTKVVNNVIITLNRTDRLDIIMSARTAIKGQIIDSVTGYPLTVPAHITIPNIAVDTYSDSHGNYEIEVTQPGAYTVYVTAAGYTEHTFNSLVFEQGIVKTQNIPMYRV